MTSQLAQSARCATLPLLVAAVASTGAVAQPADALSTLRREGHVACRPNDPYFCANVHVSCAGRTTVPTFPFTLRLTPTGAALEAAAGSEGVAEQYSAGQLELGTEGQYVIVRPAGSSGYIKLFQDGKYVFRHYPQAEGVMSLGRCG